MVKISVEDRMYLISQGVDISSPLCNGDLWGVLDIINDVIVDNIVDHNDEPDETGIKLQKIYDRIERDNRKWD